MSEQASASSAVLNPPPSDGVPSSQGTLSELSTKEFGRFDFFQTEIVRVFALVEAAEKEQTRVESKAQGLQSEIEHFEEQIRKGDPGRAEELKKREQALETLTNDLNRLEKAAWEGITKGGLTSEILEDKFYLRFPAEIREKLDRIGMAEAKLEEALFPDTYRRNVKRASQRQRAKSGAVYAGPGVFKAVVPTWIDRMFGFSATDHYLRLVTKFEKTLSDPSASPEAKRDAAINLKAIHEYKIKRSGLREKEEGERTQEERKILERAGSLAREIIALETIIASEARSWPSPPSRLEGIRRRMSGSFRLSSRSGSQSTNSPRPESDRGGSPASPLWSEGGSSPLESQAGPGRKSSFFLRAQSTSPVHLKGDVVGGVVMSQPEKSPEVEKARRNSRLHRGVQDKL